MSGLRTGALADRSDFPVLGEVTYLDSARFGLIPKPVHAAMADNHDLSGQGTVGFDDEVERRAFDEARASVGRLLNVAPDDVAIVTDASEGMSQIAWGFRTNGRSNVVLIEGDLPAVRYPWLRAANDTGQEVRFAGSAPPRKRPRLADIEACIDRDTAAVAVSHVDPQTGHLRDIRELSALAHASEALVVLDASLSVGALPLDAPELGVDVVVSSGYRRLGGATGAGFCYLHPRVYTRLNPPFVGWRSTMDPPAFDPTRIPLADTARRLEFTTPAYGPGFGLSAAIEYALDLGLLRIRDHNTELARLFIASVVESELGFVEAGDQQPVAGLVALRVDGDPKDLAGRLRERRVAASHIEGAVLFSFHHFNDGQDVDGALDALAQELDSKKRNKKKRTVN